MRSAAYLSQIAYFDGAAILMKSAWPVSQRAFERTLSRCKKHDYTREMIKLACATSIRI